MCCRFHLLKPEYIHGRIRELQRAKLRHEPSLITLDGMNIPRNICTLCRFHLLKPEYIHGRIRARLHLAPNAWSLTSS